MSGLSNRKYRNAPWGVVDDIFCNLKKELNVKMLFVSICFKFPAQYQGLDDVNAQKIQKLNLWVHHLFLFHLGLIYIHYMEAIFDTHNRVPATG